MTRTKNQFPIFCRIPGDTMDEQEVDDLRAKVPEFVKYGTKFRKAIEAVLSGGVKECRFQPSGRSLFTVVGRLGDEFIDPGRPYCSCSNFYFRVIEGREETCYHLLSYRIASRFGMLDIVQFSDEEYRPYVAAAINDVFAVLGKKGG